MSKKVYPSIPPHIKLTSKRTYEVLHTEEFKGGKTLGECRFEPPQIVLKTGQSSKEEFSTTLHEILHAVAHEQDINLTEPQVLALERGLMKVLILNKWI